MLHDYITRYTLQNWGKRKEHGCNGTRPAFAPCWHCAPFSHNLATLSLQHSRPEQPTSSKTPLYTYTTTRCHSPEHTSLNNMWRLTPLSFTNSYAERNTFTDWHRGTSSRLSAVGAGLQIVRVTVSAQPCPSSREQMQLMGWQLKNSHYSCPLTKPHHLLLPLVGYITMPLPRNVPCRKNQRTK